MAFRKNHIDKKEQVEKHFEFEFLTFKYLLLGVENGDNGTWTIITKGKKDKKPKTFKYILLDFCAMIDYIIY